MTDSKKFNIIRVWIKDDAMSDTPTRKSCIDLKTDKGYPIVDEILRYGARWINKVGWIETIPPHQILRIYFNPIVTEINENNKDIKTIEK